MHQWPGLPVSHALGVWRGVGWDRAAFRCGLGVWARLHAPGRPWRCGRHSHAESSTSCRCCACLQVCESGKVRDRLAAVSLGVLDGGRPPPCAGASRLRSPSATWSLVGGCGTVLGEWACVSWRASPWEVGGWMLLSWREGGGAWLSAVGLLSCGMEGMRGLEGSGCVVLSVMLCDRFFRSWARVADAAQVLRG